jgi:hypothetical protein
MRELDFSPTLKAELWGRMGQAEQVSIAGTETAVGWRGRRWYKQQGRLLRTLNSSPTLKAELWERMGQRIVG